jgi:hypothetical protein
MVQRSISILAMTAVLLHSVFGCCWHHAHAADHVMGAEETASSHGHAAHHCHSHSGDDAHHPGHVARQQDDEPNEPHAPCQHSPCDGDVCHFAPTVHVKVPGPDESRLTDSTAMVTGAVLLNSRKAVCYRPGVASAEAATRCYARAMTQIWLL